MRQSLFDVLVYVVGVYVKYKKSESREDPRFSLGSCGELGNLLRYLCGWCVMKG